MTTPVDISWLAACRDRLAAGLLDYYRRQGRVLPWRGTRDLYHLWLCEIMLQQTGVATVMPYYERFLVRFPTLESLAHAPLQEVLSLWQGLGYYQRARNLHRAAGRVMEQFQGQIPEEITALQTLPGIGASTAAAILATGRNQPHAILDGNCKRVLARLTALPLPISSRQGLALLWQAATLLTPTGEAGDYAQAIMDLGATVCTPRHPQCERCPWRTDCRARIRGASQDFPVTLAKKAIPERYQMALLLRCQDQLLLQQRAARGLLGGLWQPPASPLRDTPPPWGEELRTLWGDIETLPALHPLAVVRHTFTHFRLLVSPYLLVLKEKPPLQHLEGPTRWIPLKELSEVPISTLHRKVLRAAQIPA
ncbi:MAG: A/G-specific adenine glycosylase [Magnetococcales bacterium]|nr:A/G-specific adenine glycosylase [Magnetococcales bacterium]